VREGSPESRECRQRQRETVAREETEPGLGLGRGKVFLKTEYRRTGQSTVHVRCTPDSAQENGI
jgi:hypothetical protein